MKVFSAFDGMGCGRIALKEAGIGVDTYYASEINLHCVNQTKANFNDVVHVGDIRNVRGEDLGHIDLIIGGSPCQGFSKMGGKSAFDHPESRLIKEWFRIYRELKDINKNIKFLLENVPMKKDHEYLISKELGIYPIIIDSAVVSAQRRKRLYWSDIKVVHGDLFQGRQTGCKVPDGSSKTVKDIIGGTVDRACYVKTPKHRAYVENQSAEKNRCAIDPEKAMTMTARQYVSWTGTYIRDAKGLRRLTVAECSKLQNIPEWYKWRAPNKEIYRMLGNGWTVGVIKLFFELLNIDYIAENSIKHFIYGSTKRESVLETS